MNSVLKALLIRGGFGLAAEAGDDGSAGGAVDRGDNLNTDPAPTTDPDTSTDTTTDPDETDPEKSADPDADSDPAKKADDKFIPKNRFDEAVQKERSAKEEYARRLKEFEDKEAQRNVAADFAEAQKVVKDMIKQHTTLLADGELDKAADLMEKILELKEEISERKAEAKALTAKDQAKEEVRYDALVAKLEADFPQINPDAEEFDTAVVRRVQAMMSGLMQTERMSAPQALKEAVDIVIGLPKKEDAGAKQKAEDLGMRRKEEAVKKAMDAKSKQPASTNGVGVDHDKTGGALDSSAVMKMSYDEFVKLPDSKLAELRGDHV